MGVKKYICLMCCVFTLALTSLPASWANTYFVAPYGNDEGSGLADSPYQSINHAVKNLKPGDTLYLYGGTYYESVEIKVSGTKKKPILISSVEGERAVIDSGFQEFRQPGNEDWELVNEKLGEYRSVGECDSDDIYGYVLGIPGYVNERVKLIPYEKEKYFRATTDEYDGKKSEFYVGPGTMEIDDRCHIRLSKTEAMRNAEARYGQVFEHENSDPRNFQIILSQESNTLLVKGSYLTFKDITINQAKDTIELDDGAQHVTFDGITAWMGNTTISTKDTDVNNITITHSQILGDDPYWIFWSDMKDDPEPATRARGTSINLKGGSKNWFISWNLIRGSGQDLISTSNGEDRIFVHHNRIENCGDDAFELEADEKYGGTGDIGQIVIHDNFILNCLVAVSLGQDTDNMIGPLLFYRNVVLLLRDHPVNRQEGINSWNGGGQFGYGKMFKQAGSGYASENAHYYQNTLVMLNSHKGIVPIPKEPKGSTFANNIVVMINGEIIESYDLDKDQIVDGNLYWKVNEQDDEPLLDGKSTVGDLSLRYGAEQNSIGDIPKRGSNPKFSHFILNIVDKTQKYWALEPDSETFGFADFILTSESPGVGKSIAVTCRNVTGTDEKGDGFCSPNGVLVGSSLGGNMGAFPLATPSDENDYAVFPFMFTPILPTVEP
nr:right-handed parallel beta-helix repeat-containing protein [uncultured Vibrio sp.]